MTTQINTKDLSQLRYLKREISIERERITELRALAGYGKNLTGYHGKRTLASDRTGKYASEIAYLTDLIAQNMKRCICELLRLQIFFNAIEDSEIRLIFRERYIKGRSWLSIAFLLGYHDEQIPRKKHDRYVSKYNAESAKIPAQKSTDCTTQMS